MRSVFIFTIMLMSSEVIAQKTIASNLTVFESFASKHVSARDVYVRLPKNYDASRDYPVLYMHDGQMLFDTLGTWNGQSWGADKTLTRLEATGEIGETILVGIANVAKERHANYFPEKPFLMLPKSLSDSLREIGRGEEKLFNIELNADAYLKFIVFELKPFIDQNYATKPEAEHTFVAGSSMGGLISMYAFFEYPEVFGGAACLSTHWIGSFSQNQTIPAAFAGYLLARKELLRGRKIYFDAGTETLDQFYGIHQQKVDEIFKGYEKEYKSQEFKGAAHTENDWKARLHIPLKFLLN